MLEYSWYIILQIKLFQSEKTLLLRGEIEKNDTFLNSKKMSKSFWKSYKHSTHIKSCVIVYTLEPSSIFKLVFNLKKNLLCWRVNFVIKKNQDRKSFSNFMFKILSAPRNLMRGANNTTINKSFVCDVLYKMFFIFFSMFWDSTNDSTNKKNGIIVIGLIHIFLF